MESFALSQSIALNCGNSTIDYTDWGKPTLQDIGTCGWDLGEGSGEIWMSSDICEIEWPDVETDFGCYNNEGNGVSLFGSA